MRDDKMYTDDRTGQFYDFRVFEGTKKVHIAVTEKGELMFLFL
jgi:hypothetical protein